MSLGTIRTEFLVRLRVRALAGRRSGPPLAGSNVEFDAPEFEITTTKPAGQHAPRKSASLLLVAFLCTVLGIIATAGEFALGILAPTFENEIGTPATMIGLLMSAMFIASALVSLPAGWIADRYSPPTLALLQVAISASAFGSYALAHNTAAVFVTSTLVGAAMAISGPLTNRIIVMYLPSSKQAHAVGWKSLGPQSAALILGITFAITGKLVYWRVTVVVIAFVMFAFALWAYPVLKRRSLVFDTRVEGINTTPAHIGGSARANPIAWWLIPYSFFSIGVVSSVGAYLIYFATTEVSLSFSTASIASSAVAGISLGARAIWLRLLGPSNAVRLLITASVLTAMAASLLALSPTLGPFSFWFAALALGVCGLGATPLPQVVLLRNTDPRHIGTMSSWIGVGTFTGLTSQPFLMSLAIDTVGIKNSWYIVATSALLAATTMLLYSIRHRQVPGTP